MIRRVLSAPLGQLADLLDLAGEAVDAPGLMTTTALKASP